MQQVRVIVWFIAAVVVIAAGAALTSIIVPTSSGSRMLVTDCRPIPEKTSIERDSSGVPIPRRLVIRCGADEVPLVDKDAKVTDGNAKGVLLLEVEDLSRLRVHPEQVVFECTMESYSIPLFFDVLPRIEFNHYTFCAPRGKWPRGTARGLEARVYPGPFLFPHVDILVLNALQGREELGRCTSRDTEKNEGIMKAFRRLFIWSPEFCLSAAQFCAVCAMLIGVRMFAAACMEEATISRILCFVEDVADLSEVRKRTCGGHNLYHLLYVEGDEGRTFFVCDRYERIHVPLLLWEKGGLSEEVGNCERIQRPTELPLEPVPTQLSCYGKRRVCYG